MWYKTTGIETRLYDGAVPALAKVELEKEIIYVDLRYPWENCSGRSLLLLAIICGKGTWHLRSAGCTSGTHHIRDAFGIESRL